MNNQIILASKTNLPLSVGPRRNDTVETEPKSRKPRSPAGPTPPNLRERIIETDWTFRPPGLNGLLFTASHNRTLPTLAIRAGIETTVY